MLKLSSDLFFHKLFPFLYLDDWVNMTKLSKHTSDFKKNLFSCAEQIVQQRLDQLILAIFQVETPLFLQLLQAQGGLLTGSIIIEKLVGKHKFEAGDIDIFARSWKTEKENMGYSYLQRFLYKLATGQNSIPGAPFWIQTPQVSQNPGLLATRAVNDDNIFSTVLKQYGDKSLGFVWRTKIDNIHTYHINGFKIQLIEILSEEEMKMTDYIEQKFDIKACMSHYDGVGNVVLRHLDHVIKRELHMNPCFLLRAGFFDGENTARHKTRLAKYQNRGFRSVAEIMYGEFKFTTHFSVPINEIIDLKNPEIFAKFTSVEQAFLLEVERLSHTRFQGKKNRKRLHE
jgi:hypothetical protein